jgi:uncharacterized protein YndB with AHSA1/START domain
MTVTNVRRDTEAQTMTITAEFDAPVERVWKLWEDPRRLERWWGPPTWPATMVNHDLPTMTIRVTLDDRPEGGTRMVIETTFPSREAMEQVIAMGVEEGFALAVGQMDDILREADARA